MESLASYEEAAAQQRARAQNMPAERQAATAEMIAKLAQEVVPGIVDVGEVARTLPCARPVPASPSTWTRRRDAGR